MPEPVFADWRDQHRLHSGSVHFTEDVFIGRSKDWTEWMTTLTSEHRYAESDWRRVTAIGILQMARQLLLYRGSILMALIALRTEPVRIFRMRSLECPLRALITGQAKHAHEEEVTHRMGEKCRMNAIDEETQRRQLHRELDMLSTEVGLAPTSSCSCAL